MNKGGPLRVTLLILLFEYTTTIIIITISDADLFFLLLCKVFTTTMNKGCAG